MILLSVIFLLLALIFIIKGNDIWESIPKAYLILFLITLLVTEILSLFSLITYHWVFYTWIAIGVALLVGGGYLYIQDRKQGNGERFFSAFRRTALSLPEISALVIIIAVLGLTFLIAVLAPPNNYDSMTYHMPRVVHWIQQKNINFYPTSIPRQNYSMPLAEYMILQLQVLTQGDNYANLVQWSGFVIVLVAVAQIAKKLKFSRIGQYGAALFAATIPMAILQSSSTQTDIITSVFCVLFFYYLLLAVKHLSWKDALFSGIAFGLALLTKGTAYLFCAAIGLTLGLSGLFLIHRSKKMNLARMLVAIVLIGLVLNAGFYIRNWNLYGNPLSSETSRITVDGLSFQGLLANLVRNGSVHLGIPFPGVNKVISELISSMLGEAGRDPATTFPGSEFQINYLINEDKAGNLLHFILITIGLLSLPFLKKDTNHWIYPYSVAILSSIFLFSLLLKWQPWGSRLQLPIFFLSAPLFGLIIDRFSKSRFWITLLFLCVFINSLPYLFLNSTRPLVPLCSDCTTFNGRAVRRFFSNRPFLYDQYSEIIAPYYKKISVLSTSREKLYFTGNISIYEDYMQVMDYINADEFRDIGLVLGTNHWEYPIWALSNSQRLFGRVRFYHVFVSNISNTINHDTESMPDYLLTTYPINKPEIENNYHLIIDTDSIDLWGRD